MKPQIPEKMPTPLSELNLGGNGIHPPVVTAYEYNKLIDYLHELTSRVDTIAGNQLEMKRGEKPEPYLHQMCWCGEVDCLGAEVEVGGKVHHQLQKAREDLLEQMEAFTFEACPYEGTMMRAFIRSKRAELNQDPVHDFFTAPEEVQRPVYERALQKTQEEQEKLVKATAFEKVSTQFGNAIKKLGSDQPTTCNRIGGHLGDSCCCHTKTCDLDLYPTNNQTL